MRKRQQDRLDREAATAAAREARNAGTIPREELDEALAAPPGDLRQRLEEVEGRCDVLLAALRVVTDPAVDMAQIVRIHELIASRSDLRQPK